MSCGRAVHNSMSMWGWFVKKTLILTVAAALLASVGGAPKAHASQSQSEVKELVMVLLDDVAGKVERGDTKFAATECFIMRAKLVRSFARPPEDLVTKFNAICVPVLEKMKEVPATAAADAMKRYGAEVEDMAILMRVGPLGAPFDGSREYIEQTIAASKADDQASELAYNFVSALPSYKRDDEVQRLPDFDFNAFSARRNDLWDLLWGGTVASKLITEVVVPNLSGRVDEDAQHAEDQMENFDALREIQNHAEDTYKLLKAAVPDAPETKKAEALTKKIGDQMQKLYEKYVADQRMNSDTYHEADRAQLDAIVTKIIAERGKKLKRIVINTGGWSDANNRGWWDTDGSFHWSRIKTLGRGYVAVDTGSDDLQRFQQWPFSFTRTWDYEKGAFGSPRVSIAWTGAPILEKNIKL